ncbi:MAG: glycosyltransferase family 39 protein, partial [Methanobacterium sp.]|nr:glycosyltransferase family 39 protein [Methanobacterium sp.]
MDEEKKIINIENNILNEEAVLNKEEKNIQKIGKEISECKKINLGNSFKDKAINWLKEPFNLALVAVMVFAIGIRFYYFWMTKNQPLWWDELCYGSLAKNFITHAWDGTSLIIGETHIRPLIFSFLWAFLLLLHLPEMANRFILGFIPSIMSVLFIYLIGKEIYGKKVGLVASAIFSMLWLGLFYSSRFLVHMLEMALLTSSIYFFIKYLKDDQKLKYFLISLVLLSFATLTRYQDGMMFFVYFIVLLVTRKLYLNKAKFWYYGIAGFIPLLLFFLMNLLTQ